MTDCTDSSYPSDICLMLRAHGEHRWLSSKVLPVLRQLTPPQTIPDDELGAALAYLEVLWIDATRHAAETEAAFKELMRTDPAGERPMNAQARRYHASARALRGVVGRQVCRLIGLPGSPVTREPACH
jgi:hypothetical protein